MSPRVSIVLPAFNAAATITTAVRSLIAQTFGDWELLVVDDGSSDDTAAMADAAAQGDARFRLLRQTHGGIVAALEAALAVAGGEFVARMDADDEAHPERLAAQVALLDAQPDLGLASCLVEFGGERAANLGYALHVDWINALQTPEEIALNRFVESPLAHPSVIFRRGLLERHGGYHAGAFPEDYDLWLRWLDAGVRMAKVPRPLLRWNDPPGRLSRTDPRYSPEVFFAAKAPWIAAELRRMAHARPVWIWGAGRPTRRRASALEACGVAVAGYIDVDPKKATPALGGRGAPVVTPDRLPRADEAFVLGYVASRGARDLIREALRQAGFGEGRDFLMCA